MLLKKINQYKKVIIKSLLVIFVMSIAINSYAYSWKKCKKGDSWAGAGAYGFLIGNMLLSTMEFSTSTGGCAMIGMVGHDKKVFIAQNLEQLKLESVLGAGEYISAYATIAGCSREASLILFNELQNNYDTIYGKDYLLPFNQVHNNIEKLIKHNEILSKSCRIKV